MDPALNSIIGPWGQFGIIGSVVITLGVCVVFLWRALTQARTEHVAEVKACNAQVLDVTIKKIDSDNRLANALEGVERVVETALNAMKK